MSVTPIVTSLMMRECEQRNFDARRADPVALMEIAGRGCAGALMKFLETLPASARRRIIILAGHGNNGGDGIVIANTLVEEFRTNTPVEIQFAATVAKLSPSAAFYYRRLSPKVAVSEKSAPDLPAGSIIIDALLGTGIRPPLRAPFDAWIAAVNASGLPVFAVDLPSGLGCENAIHAAWTATIGFFKDSLFTEEGVECSGRLVRVPLPLPVAPEVPPQTPCAVDREFYRQTELPLSASAHKYSRGAVLIAGGSVQYPHAPVLSARAALRTGAGLVTLALPSGVTLPDAPLALIVRNLSGSCSAFDAHSLAEVKDLSAKCAAIAVGPGLGRNLNVAHFVRGVLALPQPLVLDADALYFASKLPETVAGRSGITILTPHEGEAACLARGAAIQAENRMELAQKLANAYHAVVVLKGARTVIAAPDGSPLWLNTSGTPALATAGSGDVLTGMIAAELASRRAADAADAQIAAARAVFLHGCAGEAAAEQFGTTGVIADDLPEFAAKARCSMMFR